MSNESSGSVSRRRFIVGAGATGAVALAGCTKNQTKGSSGGDTTGTTGGSGGDGNLSGSISISGSSTVFPLAVAMKEEFQKEHPGMTIDIKSTGSGGGFQNHFCPGQTDFNNASRPIKDKEAQKCKQNNIDPVELNVATDALTVVVNNNADWVDCMTVEQLKKLWQGGNNKVQKWSDIDSSWPNKEIKLYGPTEASGTLDYFHEAIVGEDNKHRMDHQASENDRQIIQGVSRDKYALGYLGFAYYSENKDEVKALGINNGDGCIKPSLETAKSGKYKPLARPLFTYPKKSALKKDHVAAFAKFWIEHSTSKQIVAKDVGYVPLSESEKKKQMKKLEKAISKANGN
ncbi:phosphate ABC transporter substrate-binding protein PstS family protein [Haladaptatus halobius]|uniref:phosphate ABC transporter substrate-binding protein PstS family protein n=1 Tax=Haladaptatus halobius TaxID=2884875 RepID=UPI001D0A6EFB|nr:phosphate ABC transporter substrate-binding protein PstS family protein [Haladaptatus halobius]